jgi:hypothetical protein
MISWRFAIPIILGVAVVAGCIVYIISSVPPHRVKAVRRLPPPLPKVTSSYHETAVSTEHPSEEEHISAYQRAAQAILTRVQNAKASADEPIPTGRIQMPKGRVPLPKKRPIPRP